MYCEDASGNMVKKSSARGSNVSYFLFALALVTSTWIKLAHLGSRELWLDETYSAYVASTGFFTLLKNTLGDLHPPLFHILLWGWIRAIGPSQSQLRLFSVVLDVLATAAMFWSARIILGRRLAGYAALLFAFTPMLFIYGMEVRSYMLLILIITLLLGLHWRFLFGTRGKQPPVAYAIAGALLFYVHYLAILILFGLLVHAVVTRLHQRVSLRSTGIAAALVIVLCLPGGAMMIKQRLNSNHASQRQALQNANPSAISHRGMGKDPGTEDKPVAFWTKSIPITAGIFPARSRAVLALCALPLLVAFGAGLYLTFRGDKVCTLTFLVSVSFLVGLALLHMYATRYVLPLVPLIVISLSRVVQKTMETNNLRLSGIFLGSLIALVYIAGFYRQAMKPHGRPWQDAVGVLQTVAKPDDEIVFSAPYAQVPFDYFARQKGLYLHEVGFPISIYTYWNSQDEVKGWGSPIVLQPELEDFVGQLRKSAEGRRIWLLSYEDYFYDPENRLQTLLSHSGSLHEVQLPKDPDNETSGTTPLRLYEYLPARTD